MRVHFKTYKKELTKKYNEVNKNSLIEIEIPSELDMFKTFLSEMVFTEHRERMERPVKEK